MKCEQCGNETIFNYSKKDKVVCKFCAGEVKAFIDSPAKKIFIGLSLLIIGTAILFILAQGFIYTEMRESAFLNNAEFQKYSHSGEVSKMEILAESIKSKVNQESLFISSILTSLILLISRWTERKWLKHPILYYVLFGLIPGIFFYYGWRYLHKVK